MSDVVSTEQNHLASAVGRLTRWLRDGATSGELAELRRLSADDGTCPALYRALAVEVEPVFAPPRGEEAAIRSERRWGAILQAMAVAPHLLGNVPDLGATLGEHRFAELRLERLLRATDVPLFDEVRAMAAFLASKGATLDAPTLARLVLFQDGEAGERVRRGIARSYYRVVSQNLKSTSSR